MNVYAVYLDESADEAQPWMDNSGCTAEECFYGAWPGARYLKGLTDEFSLDQDSDWLRSSLNRFGFLVVTGLDDAARIRRNLEAFWATTCEAKMRFGVAEILRNRMEAAQ